MQDDLDCSSSHKQVSRRAQEPHGKPKIARLCALLIYVLIPLAIVAGYLIGDQSYYLTSIVVMLLAMLPPFVSFEQHRPQARELVVLAVLVAIAVASRAAFFWLPNFKPMTGIIIIAAIALGSRTGFVTGALAAFVSNFIFGQGPWTPWQMFAYGVAGFVFGLLAEHGVIARHDLSTRAKLSVSCAAAALVIVLVGPILDTCALFLSVSAITPESAAAIYASGLPVNIVHASVTFLTIYIAANPMLDKLERTRVKYGMME